MPKILTLIFRLFLGIILLGAGINGFVVGFGFEPFIATSDAAMTLFEFQYLLFAEKTLEIICGILLLLNRFIPLTLAILAPIIMNILLLHIFLDPSLLVLAIVLFIFHAYLLFIYRESFLPLLKWRVSV